MQYESPIPDSTWQNAPHDHASLPQRNPIAVDIDHIRLARLLIFAALFGFWAFVIMAVF